MALTVGSLGYTAQGFDTDTVISSEAEASCIVSKTNYSFVGRYISLQSTEQPGDLTHTELVNLAEAFLYVALIQHALAGGTVLTQALGTTYGQHAVANAKSISAPAGAYLWLDIENYGSGSDPIGFCEAWSNAVKADGTYHPALYFGAPGLSSGNVETLVNGGYFAATWSGCGAPKGFGESIDQGPCDIQINVTCSGTEYSLSADQDTIEANSVGGFVIWS